MRVILMAVMVLVALPVFAEDWTTTDGKKYEDVRIVKVEDDAITVIYKEGGALIAMTKLPPELQKRFSYDPVKAKAAADARAKADASNAKDLQAEIDLAQKMKKDKAISEASTTNATPNPAPAP